MSQPSGLNPRADHLTYRSGLRNTYGAGKSRHLGKVPSQIKFACLPQKSCHFFGPRQPYEGGGALHSQFYIFSFIELFFTFPVYFYGGGWGWLGAPILSLNTPLHARQYISTVRICQTKRKLIDPIWERVPLLTPPGVWYPPSPPTNLKIQARVKNQVNTYIHMYIV